MLVPTTKHLRRDKRGLSNVIIVMLSLVLVVIIASNVILWSYQMNQFDWERIQENVEISNVTISNSSYWSMEQGNYTVNTVTFTLENRGALTVRIVSLWIDSSTIHQRYNANLFINSADSSHYTLENASLPEKPFIVRSVTERGTVSVFRLS